MGSKSGDRRAVNSGQVKRGELWPVQVGPLRRREAEGARWRPPAPLIETRSIAARDVVSGGYRMEARINAIRFRGWSKEGEGKGR